VALSAPARPLSRAARPPRITNTRHAAVRASHFVPGVSDVRQARPLQAQPPRRPIGAQPGGKGRGTRKARRREINRVARTLLTPDRPAQQHRSFLQGVLRILSPHNVYGGASTGTRRPAGAIATAPAGGTGLLSPPSTMLPGRVIKNVATVIARDPKKQIPKLLKDTGESIVSIPAGVVRSATHPEDAAKNIVKDYSRRYGPLLKGDEDTFRKRMEKEGVAPEVFDIAGTATAGAGAAGRGLQKLAEVGTLGKEAQRVATARPALRVSGGIVKKQPISDNFFRNVVRAGVDATRKDVQVRRASSPQASALVREAEQAGEVTPITGGGRAQRKSVAQAKGRQLQTMKAEQQAEVGASTKAIASLSKPEQRAFKYAAQYGITTPETARTFLARHRDNVKINRAEHEARTGESIPARQNELPEIDYLLKNADQAFTPRVAETARAERGRAQKAASLDPGVALGQAEARRVAPLAQLLRVPRREGETSIQYIKRVESEAARHGLQSPGYFPSEKRAEGVFSTFAVGGRQAVAGPKAYTGALTATGRESTALDVLPRGIARNIKRKYNWNLVADNFDRHAYDWSRGKTLEELKDEMERRGIDPKSVAFWNPRKFKDEQQGAAALEGPDAESTQLSPEAASVHGAAQLATNPAAFKNSTGWSLIPKAVHDEIMADIRPSGALGRGFDVIKGKTSRVLLANPGWLQFQVGSNALLTGLTGTGPVDAVKAQVWWRKLPEHQKRAIEPYLGVHRWYDDQTHLGAAANNRIVNAYRAFKETALYKAAHKANPFDLLFKADNAQNNFFRKAVFYNQAKRETYRRMGQEAGRVVALQERAARILSLPPQDRMEAVVRDADTFERLAEHTNKFLGDYTTYTAKERRLLGRSVMFYGFLRYSVKFTLYTMPIEHPIVSSMLTQIGRLERDEQKKIFGADVPPWEFGNLYTQSGRKYALARLSPFFNAVQYGEPGSLTSSLSPAVQVVLNQVASKDVTFDKPFTVKGSGQYVEKGSEIGHPLSALLGPFSTRGRIATEELLRLSPYYRLAEKGGIPGVPGLYGKQTSESTLFRPDPVRYKKTTKQSREAAARNAQSAAEQRSGGPGRQLREQLLPLLGQEGQDTIRKAREFDKAKQKKKRKKKAGPPDLLGGGGNSAGQLPDLLGP
jgi:hypothetical protein